jgi:hypothetical protein
MGNQTNRRQILSAIVKLIQAGKYDSSYVPLEQLMKTQLSERNEYQAPFDRDTYNYGYTDIGQMNANEKAF